MAETIERTICPRCLKKNLCQYKADDGIIKSRCMTVNCKAQNYIRLNKDPEPEQSFIDFKELPFEFLNNYRGLSIGTQGKSGMSVYQKDGLVVTKYIHMNPDGTTAIKYGQRPKKIFSWENKKHNTMLFNLHNCTDFTKPIIITEGNEDCATLIQLKYQATSVHSSGDHGLLTNKEYLDKFPEIWYAIEDDEAGKKLKETIREIFSHKILKEIDLNPRKDANEYIRDDIEGLQPDIEELKSRITNAKEIKPEGLIFGNEIDIEDLYLPMQKGIMTPLPLVNSMIRGGMLPGDLWVLCGGVSIGKSSLLRMFCNHFRIENHRIANLFVEESKKVSQLNYIAEVKNIPIGDLLVDPTIIPKEEFNQICQEVFDNNSVFIDEYWKRTTDNLLRTIKYLTSAKKYDIIVLDHITSIINASGTSKHGKVHDIDWLMEELFNIARQTGVRIIVISHLNRGQAGNKRWDEGAVPSMYDLRGSGSLEGKPDVILGFSRNLKDPFKVDQLNIHVLKNRWFSEIGDADTLDYIKSTGRLRVR